MSFSKEELEAMGMTDPSEGEKPPLSPEEIAQLKKNQMAGDFAMGAGIRHLKLPDGLPNAQKR